MKFLLPTGHPNFVEAEVVRTKRHRDVWTGMRLYYAPLVEQKTPLDRSERPTFFSPW